MDTGADSATVKRKLSSGGPSDIKRKKTAEDEPIGFELELDAMGAGAT